MAEDGCELDGLRLYINQKWCNPTGRPILQGFLCCRCQLHRLQGEHCLGKEITMLPIGLMLIGLGLLYWIKPGIFRRGIWMKTSIAIRLFSEENYRKYMRTLGVILIVVGVALVILALSGGPDLVP